MEFSHPLNLGDWVNIDGDMSLRGRITGFCCRSDDRITIQVAWLHNGSAQSAWIEDWRVTPTKEER